MKSILEKFYDHKIFKLKFYTHIQKKRTNKNIISNAQCSDWKILKYEYESLTILSTIFQLYCGDKFSFGGGNQSTQRKPTAYIDSLTNFYHISCIEYTQTLPGIKFTTLLVIDADLTVNAITIFNDGHGDHLNIIRVPVYKR